MAEPSAKDIMLAMLKLDLGISNTTYDTRLGQHLDVAKAEIKKAGASTLNDSDLPDQQLIVMYAAWLFRMRSYDAGKYGLGTRMPDMLQYHLNNRIFKDHMGGGADV